MNSPFKQILASDPCSREIHSFLHATLLKGVNINRDRIANHL
jgi:hypothetical protein